MSSLNVQLVAADRQVWEGEAAAVYARTEDGEIGILPGHQPLMSVLAAGDMHIEPAGGGREDVHTDGGFISVDHDSVTILADTVEAAGLGKN